MKKLLNGSLNFVLIVFTAIFWVIACWGYWDKGVLALGWNATVFLFGFWIALDQKRRSMKEIWTWVMPIFLIFISFALWENPFLKNVSFFLLPVLLGIFYAYGQLKDKSLKWTERLFADFIERAVSFIPNLGKGGNFAKSQLLNKFNSKNKELVKNTFLGIGILIILFLVVIPLLAASDERFAEIIRNIGDWITSIIEISTVWKAVFAGILIIVFSSIFVNWNDPLKPQKTEKKENKKYSSLISGIILGGLLVVYFLFLYLQLEKLIVGNLPIDFSQTERLVKSGFWQLFFLSIINGGLFFVFYRKTEKAVQIILQVFILASSLILLSAAWRMGLYIFYYGLSYEKFFAGYTVLFCLFVLCSLIIATFYHKKIDIVKFLAFSFLWFYGVLTVLPVEQIIFRTNLSLSHRVDTRIQMHELKMLSSDVYKNVVKYVKSNNDLDCKEFQKWEPWSRAVQKRISERKWYETNLSLELNKPLDNLFSQGLNCHSKISK